MLVANIQTIEKQAILTVRIKKNETGIKDIPHVATASIFF